jgi:hypothetical protein
MFFYRTTVFSCSAPYLIRKTHFHFFNKKPFFAWQRNCNFSNYMNMRPVLTVTIFFLLLFTAAQAQQQINGVVSDIESRTPLADVHIKNVHTDNLVITDSAGQFSMEVDKGQLVEFHRTGYRTERMRIPEGIVPPFFKIFLEKDPIRLPEYIVNQRGYDWKRDSLHYYETYKHALNFPQFSTLDAIRHPFSALSKRNRQIWAFQREYNWFEQEKYVDYTFNERIVHNLTGMPRDSAQAYLKIFRPTYEQLRSMTEYDFYNYIRYTVQQYREGYNPRRPVIRGSQ